MANHALGIPSRTGLQAPRRTALATIALAVTAMHALVLLGWPVGAGDGWRREGIQPLQVRQIALAPQGATGPAPDPRPAGAKLAQTPARPAANAAAAAPPRARPTPPAAPLAAGPVDRVADQAVDRVADRVADRAANDAAPGASAPAVDAGGAPPPVHATRIAPSATLQYELRRGAAVGEGRLEWRHDDRGYELALLGFMREQEAVGWTSRGAFDPAGLAPERFVVRRRGRELQAANFQRDNGRITFSGPAVELPVVAGMQDRVSWVLQLAAIIEATPSLGRRGQEVSMIVVGTRGDAELWIFEARDATALELPEGRVENAVHLVRPARRPYDVQAEIWLDPARHHLPLQLRLQALPSGESTDFRLRALKMH